jgi:ribose-phosphate pyrophosphokinase
MPYIPHARMDRVKNKEDIFTLKYFCEVINSLDFKNVKVFDPHSDVAPALLDRVIIYTPESLISYVVDHIDSENLLFYFPDAGAAKRYSSMISAPYTYGNKIRDWETGQIKGLTIADSALVNGKDILIIDDICSRGGTFYHSAKALKEAGAKNIYLYITHCENTILEGELLTSGLVEKIYTTNSIFTKEHEKIEVFTI